MLTLLHRTSRNPEEVDNRKIESEKKTKEFLQGNLPLQDYLSYLKKMDEYVDFRRLAAEIQSGKE